jgi:hypothetical protein
MNTGLFYSLKINAIHPINKLRKKERKKGKKDVIISTGRKKVDKIQ